MTTKKKTIKTYAFIDTNIFLDFYRSQNETSLSLLRKLEGVKERIICTYQVEMEFLKNRQRAIVENLPISNLSIDARLPAVMDDSQLSASLKKEKKELQKRKNELQKRITNIIKNPSRYDPIYKSLESIFSSENEHVLTRDMNIRHKIKRLAWRRFMLGYPPRKSNDTSIGDALNWEWFIHCCSELKGKFIIVSRDSDYGAYYNDESFLNDALKAEFRDRVGRKSITYTTKLSDALKLLEVSITKQEESEEEQILSTPPTSSDSATSSYHFDLNGLNLSKDIAQRMQTPNLEAFAKIAEQQIRLSETLNKNGALDKIREQQEMISKFLERLNKK